MGSRNNKPGRIVKGTAKQPTLKDASGIWTLDEAMQAHRANAWPQPNLFQPVANSLRLDGSRNTFLSKAISRSGNQRTWTWSGWFKPSTTTGSQYLFVSTNTNGNPFTYLYFSNAVFRWWDNTGAGSFGAVLNTNAVYRDTNAWYHVVLAVDTNQSTEANRAKFYINGVQVTSFTATSYPLQGEATYTNSNASGENVAYISAPPGYVYGYLAEVNFVDGYQLDPGLLGKFDTNNTWVPVAYTGAYGTNGFYLPFNNAATSQTLGYDASLNGTAIYDADQDPYRGSVALHLTGNGPAGGNNNTFVDSSTNNYAVTRSGTVTQGSFSPFPLNTNAPYNPAVHGASAYFNGTTDYLTSATGIGDFGTSDFTVEYWAMNDSTNPTNYCPQVGTLADGTPANTWRFGTFGSNGRLYLATHNGTSFTDTVFGTTVYNDNCWHHYALIRTSGSVKAYVDGVQVGSTTSVPTNLTSGKALIVGREGFSPTYYKGYISNLRIIKNVVLYTANFTPTNRPFGTLTNNLLTFSEDFTTYTTLNVTITGGAGIAPDGTPSATKINATTSGNKVIYPAGLSAGTYTASVYAKAGELEGLAFATGTTGIFVNLRTGTIRTSYSASPTSSSVTAVGNGWYRCAFTFTLSAGNSLYIGPNDNVDLSLGSGITGTGSNGIFVWGAQLESGSTLTNYTPTPANYSTAPSLLLNFANAAIVDSAGANNLVTVSNATITSAAKYGSGALTFNGTSDYLQSPAVGLNAFGASDFTIEAWISFNSVAAGQLVSAGTGGQTNAYYWQYYSSQLQFGVQSVGAVTVVNWTPTANIWYHVCVMRQGPNYYQFVNGQQISVATYSQSWVDGPTYIGYGGAGYFNGKMDDVRITRGVARYNFSGFTPPARALPEVGGKSFVTNNINAGVVKTFTTTGTTAWTAPVDVTQVEVLVVAGGGGGANYNSAGGGGAGGLIYNNAYPVTPGQTYTVSVGAGGAGGGTLGDSGSAALGASTSGGNSVFGALIAIGGGNGGQGNVQGSRTADQNPSAGGSGGGARGSSPYNVGGAGTGGQGFAGGNSGTYATNYPGGGGGGAGGAGGNGAGDTTAGNGGVGLQFGISGTPTYYAGGGGGSTQNTGTNSTGGLGGGGAGGSGSGGSFRDGVSGTANTGGGGGAGGFQPQYGVTGLGGNGGSGIVIVRYTTTSTANTSDATSDNLVDSPTQYGHDFGNGGEVVGNYATWNPLIGANYNNSVAIGSSIVVLSNGNLNAYNPALGGSAPKMQCHSNIGMTTGKWYAEFTGLSGRGAGISLGDYILHNGTGSGVSNGLVLQPTGGVVNPSAGVSATVTGTAVAISTTDVVGVAFDVDNRVCYYYRNGVLTQTASNITTTLGTPYISSGVWYFSSQPESSGSASYITANFGQRAWAYAPPAGFNALTTKNFARLTAGTPAANPNQYFDAVTYTGNGATQTIGGLNFQPDLVWIKSRSNAYNHGLQDSVRGIGKVLYSNLTSAEDTGSISLTSFASNGFGLGNDSWNGSGITYAAWCWKAGGTAVSNTSGTITSQASANTASGFSIATWTGSNANSATIGHGLTSAPSMFIIKPRNATAGWYTWHTGLTGPTYGMSLNAADAQAVFTYGTATVGATTITAVSGANGLANVNATSTNYVGYFWTEVPGFSKFGSYVGNGNADGPFVYTGFRPAFILTKDITTGSYWWEMVDSARAPFNPSDKTLYANVADTEYTSSGYNKDLLSNGFKIRGTSGGHNTLGSTYIYMAFAGNTFGNVNGTAR